MMWSIVACLQTFSCCSEWNSCVYRRNWCSSVACRAGSPIVVCIWCSCMYPSLSGLLLLAEVLDLLLFCMMFVQLSQVVYCVCILHWVVFCCLQRFSTYFYSVWCSYNCPKWSTVYLSFLEWSSVACRAGSPIIVSVWCSCMYLPMKWSTIACRGSPIRPELCVCDMICSDLCELCVCGMISSDLCICSWQCVLFSHCSHVTSRNAHALLCQWMGCRIEC
jgi:hypothetical protein